MSGLEPFAENVWIMDGPPVRFLSLDFPTRLIVVKLSNGLLWVNSPVTVSAQELEEIKALGKVNYLVAPNTLHVWRLEEWHRLFPDAELWGPEQVPKQFKGLPFAGRLGDRPPTAWENDLDQLVFRGNLFIEEVWFLHKKSATVVLADFIQSHRPVPGKPFYNALVKLDGIAFPKIGVPRDIRLSFTDRKLARRSLERLLSWDFDKLIIAHGECIPNDAKAVVKQAFRWLSH